MPCARNAPKLWPAGAFHLDEDRVVGQAVVAVLRAISSPDSIAPTVRFTLRTGSMN